MAIGLKKKISEAKKSPASGIGEERRGKLAKQAKKGKDFGKKGPGTGFKAVEKAAKKGGAKDPKAVAGAMFWKMAKKKGWGK